jgi:hypothetical protein
MLQQTWQNPQNVPVPPTGSSTFFFDATNGGAPSVKIDATTWFAIGGGSTVSFPNEANLTSGDIGKMLMSAAEGLVPTQTEPYSINGEATLYLEHNILLPSGRVLQYWFQSLNLQVGDTVEIRSDPYHPNYPLFAGSGILNKVFTIVSGQPSNPYEASFGAQPEIGLASAMNALASGDDIKVWVEFSLGLFYIDSHPADLSALYLPSPLDEWGGIHNLTLWKNGIQVYENYTQTYQTLGTYDEGPFIFEDNVNSVNTTIADLFNPNIGVGKVGTSQWGLIFPTTKSELAQNIKATLDALLTDCVVTINNAEDVTISQNYEIDGEVNYDIHQPYFVYDYNLIMPMQDAFNVVKNPVINVLQGINADGTLAVNNGEFFDVVCVDAVVFDTEFRKKWDTRLLIAANGGKMRTAYSFAIEMIQSGNLPEGGSEFDSERPSNELREFLEELLNGYELFEAVTECAANGVVRVRRTAVSGYEIAQIWAGRLANN